MELLGNAALLCSAAGALDQPRMLPAHQPASLDDAHAEPAVHAVPAAVQEEVYKVRLGALKREEDMVRQEAARLEAEKIVYIRCDGVDIFIGGGAWEPLIPLGQQGCLLMSIQLQILEQTRAAGYLRRSLVSC